jgi:hypothetical protein
MGGSGESRLHFVMKVRRKRFGKRGKGVWEDWRRFLRGRQLQDGIV